MPFMNSRQSAADIIREGVGMKTAAHPFPRQVTTRCLHCDRRTRELTHDGLCGPCDQQPGIRDLYIRSPGWTPAHEAMLRELRRRAMREVSLFPLPERLTARYRQGHKPAWWRPSRDGRERRRHIGKTNPNHP